MAHTPGPWRLSCNEAGYSHPFIVADDARHGQSIGTVLICRILVHRLGSADRIAPAEIQDANARLIAAAPALLASLKALLPMAIADVEEYGGNPDTDARIIAAREAIAKATRP